MASARVAPRIANSPLFREAVEKLLSSWPALQVAVVHQAGGPDTSAKARWLVGVISGFFADNDDLCPDEIVSFVEDIMDVEFDVYVQDGSLEELAQHLCEAYRLMVTGSEDELRAKLAALKSPDLSVFSDGTAEAEHLAATAGEAQARAQAQQTSTLADRLGQVAIGSADQNSQASTSGEAAGQASSSADAAMETEDDGWTVVARAKKR